MAEPLALSLTVGESAPVAIEWSADEFLALSEATASPWALAQPIEWGGIETLRILSASFEDNSLLALAALRPAGRAGHGDEHVGAVLRRGGSEETDLEQVLLSTEYGSDGEPTRIGIELHPGEDEVPLRAAGDSRGLGDASERAGDGASTGDGQQLRSATVLDMRLDGVAGTGLFEILRAP